jgi:hypothetical protein
MVSDVPSVRKLWLGSRCLATKAGKAGGRCPGRYRIADLPLGLPMPHLVKARRPSVACKPARRAMVAPGSVRLVNLVVEARMETVRQVSQGNGEAPWQVQPRRQDRAAPRRGHGAQA